MVDPFSESELLEFIEDKLAPRRVESLRRRLAESPRIEAMVEQMRADRAALRAVEEPALPIDFVVELEPQLARAAVTTSVAEATPGAYRRRHRRTARRRTLNVRYAAAAGFVIVVLGATWAALQIVSRPGAPTEVARQPIALDSGQVGSSAGSSNRAPLDGAIALHTTAPGEDLPWPPPGTDIHHAEPLPAHASIADDRALAPRTPLVPQATLVPGAGEAVVGRFSLVLRATDHDTGERRLETVLAAAGLGGDSEAGGVALVRNYTVAEARRIIDRWQSRGMLSDEPPEVVSGLSGANGDPKRQARRFAGIMRRHRDRLESEEEVRTSRRLFGPPALAPSYERQLELSGLGATHTVTVRVSDLAALVAQLHEPGATELRPLEEAHDGDDAIDDRSALQRWIDNHELARTFVDELRDEYGPDAWLMLPVVIDPTD